MDSPRLRAALLDPTANQELARVLRDRIGNGSLHEFRTSRHLWAHLDATANTDLVVIYVGQSKDRVLELIRKLRRRDNQLPIIAVASLGSVDIASAAIGAGATDFLVASERLGDRIDTLLAKIQGLVALVQQNRALQEDNRSLQDLHRDAFRLIGVSAPIQAVLRQIERVALIPRPVLIVGERGTGKELVARAIHEKSGTGIRPFVAVNCAALADSLLESELFGHERGSFTGAERTTRGKFEQAASGTLFLDEIGNMSLPFQQKILRVIEYGTFSRVGSSHELQTTARIVAATNVNLEQKMREGLFLRDLYDRLAFEIISIPPLRERGDDIEPLAQYFLERFMSEIPALQGKQLANSAIRALERHSFPGNVRELRNIVERAAYRDVTNEITPEDIGFLSDAADVNPCAGSFHERVEAFESQLLRRAMLESQSNQADAARRLGMTYDQFRHYARKHGVI